MFGQVRRIKRKVVVITLYIPPKTDAPTMTQLNDFLSDILETAMRGSPIVFITGDLNKKKIDRALEAFPDVVLLPTQATRGNSTLDVCYTNSTNVVSSTRILPPLESNDGATASDHSIISVRASVPAFHEFQKREVRFRPYTKKGEEKFGNLLIQTDWQFLESGDDDPANLLSQRLDEYTNICFPEKRRVFKSTELPWITKELQLMSRRKKREYARRRRSRRWEKLDQEFQNKLMDARENFFEKVKDRVKTSNNTREYFKTVKMMSDRTGAKEEWTIRDLYNTETDQEVAEDVAEFFNKISQEYTPLQTMPSYDCSDLCPAMHEISARLKFCKKPRSQVPGDIHPKLVTKYADLLAIPLHMIFKENFKNGSWPPLWKSETVTVIPKCARPKSLGELRNLSCTPLFSKVMEHFLLKRLKEETKLSPTQFGGLKGTGVDHFLIETWDKILRSLEDNRAAASIISIDMEKAFNRMCHNQCLLAAERLGASDTTIRMIRAFLTKRSMKVKILGTQSRARMAPGGSPQGSILANYLFCMTTDQFPSCADRVNEANQTEEFDQNGGEPISEDEEFIPEETSPIRRPDPLDLSMGESEEEDEILASNFIYFNNRNRINDTELSSIADQGEIERVFGIPEGWIDENIEVKVYIDDMNAVEKIMQTNAVSRITEGKRTLKVHARKTEKFMENVADKAEELKMVLNAKKTQILCISAAVYDNVVAYIRPRIGGEIIEMCSTDKLKILGFHFDGSPSVSYHIDSMCKKFQGKLWSLRQLRDAGMSRPDLLYIYKTVLRPVIEFACPTYGPMLSSENADRIERLQLKIMKIIYGNEISYRTVIRETSIETLADRRSDLIKKFATKTASNPRFASTWFPKNPIGVHDLRRPQIYVEEKCRTNRLYNSPIFKMRRILNM